MKTKFNLLLALVLLSLEACYAQKTVPSLVDYDAFEQLVKEVKSHRAAHLLPLPFFITKSKEPNTVILDTRSREMYNLKHVAGAVHLNFSDFTQHNLDSIMAKYAGSSTQILIYCNNNFEDRQRINLQDLAFITKVALPERDLKKLKKLPPGVVQPKPLTLALNIPTYINLYGYGYKNVYELSELVEVHDPRIHFEGTGVQQ